MGTGAQTLKRNETDILSDPVQHHRFSLWQYEQKKDEVGASMGLDNERRRDLVWAGFVCVSIFVPILVFGIDVFFYIESNAVLDRLEGAYKQCNTQLVNLKAENQTATKAMDIDNIAKKYSAKLQLYNTYEKNVIESYRYNLDGRFRPCLLLSLILSVGMSIFFRIIVLGFRHRDVPSAILAIILHSLLPTYMNVCVVQMDTYLFDIRQPVVSPNGTATCDFKDISIVEQICSFKRCQQTYGSTGCTKEQTANIQWMQRFNRRAKQFDWLISSIILLFVLFNFFKYLDEKRKLTKRLEKQNGGYDLWHPSGNGGSISQAARRRKRQSIVHNSLLQLVFYIVALISFPIMFSVPYWIHKFWEAQEIRMQIKTQESCGYGRDHVINELINSEVIKEELLNSIFLISGCVLWISLILSAIYHLARMILFSNKTEPASIMCHY